MTGETKERGQVKEDIRGVFCSVASAVLFGLAPFLAKAAYHYGVTSYMLAFLRFLSGSLFLLLIIVLQHRDRILRPFAQLSRIFIIAFFYGLMIVLLFSSYQYIDSGPATTLHFCYPVFVILLSALLLHRRLGRKQLGCTVLAGMGIICLNNGGMGGDKRGIILALLSGLAYAFCIVLTEKYEMNTLPVFVFTWWISVFASFDVGVFLLLTRNLSFSFQVGGWGVIVVLALVTNVLAIVLFQKGLSLVGGVKSSLLSTFEPLTSVVVGTAIFRETLTGNNVIGILLILAATVLLLL